MVAEGDCLQVDRAQPFGTCCELALERSSAVRPDALREFTPAVDVLGVQEVLEIAVQDVLKLVAPEKSEACVVAGEEHARARNPEQTRRLLVQQAAQIGG